MDRFYPAAAPATHTSRDLVGTSSLVGPYTCSYRKCGRPYAQLGRFQALSLHQPGDVIVACASVCSPECAAAYNRYQLSAADPESDTARARHALLEKVYGRRIKPAPAPHRIATLDRLDWLRDCRGHLSATEQEVAERELSVQEAVASSVPNIK